MASDPQRARTRARRPLVIDPPIGAPRAIGGIEAKPGEFTPTAEGLPPDCPVEPLGMDGDILYLMDTLGQLAAVTPSNMGQKFCQRLFGDRQNYLYWAWPRFNKDGVVTSFRAEKVAEAFYTAAARRGLFSPVDRVRGRGAWRERDGSIVYHSGDALWSPRCVDNKGHIQPMETGFRGGVLYARRPEILSPAELPVTPATNPARFLLVELRRWNWERPEVDPVLFLGWIAAAMLGGALPWRPSAFVVGDKATGKSTMQAFVKGVLGDGVVQTADTSAAGIYQHIGQDSLPVAIDELEAEADNKKAMAVVTLARLSASGAVMLRGGQSHIGVEFRAQSCFFFSSINPPPLAPADASRIAMLRLRRLSAAATAGPSPVLDAETTGPRLLRQLLDNFQDFDRLFEHFRGVLREGGHDGRGQDTFGVLLACANLALGDELAEGLGVPFGDRTNDWSELLHVKTMLEYEDHNDNWLLCLRHLLTSRVEAWRGGERATVGALIEAMERDYGQPNADVPFDKGLAQLGQAGLSLMPPRGDEDGFMLAVPNESPLVHAMFKDTVWAGAPGASVWKSALRQAPPAMVCVDKARNRVRINGVQQRCTLVRLEEFRRGE